MNPVFIALGSNIEPRLQYLSSAIDQFQSLGTVKKIAPLYRSSAYGVKEQSYFFNSACLLNTNFLPLDLLKALKDIERKIGRKERFHWGPREIDLDIIFYNDKIVQEESLVIPHPDYKNRRFVLQPLADMEADYSPPGEIRNLRQLLLDCPDNTHIKLEKKNWYDKWK
jgi:2-amino-4-hydroxy-6-hydroxymethyldihydropteridine diphosphokinase